MRSVEETLKNHVATYERATLLNSVVERIIFRDPNSSNYYMSFLAFDRTLVVTGDAYDAIYEVGMIQRISFWAGCDACYISQKMRGINGYSKDTKVWNDDKARERLKKEKEDLRKEVLEEYRDYYRVEGGEQTDEGFAEFCKKRDEELKNEDPDDFHFATGRWLHWEEHRPEEYIISEWEWGNFLSNHGQDVFGDCDMPYDIGFERNPQIDFHVESLRLAVKQLKEKGVELL